MEDRRGAATGLVQHWVSLSDGFLAAARALPGDARVGLPRTHLAALAVEFRLKAYCCASRGGTPDTADLTRLAALAGYCGLQLAPARLRCLHELAGIRFIHSADAPWGASGGAPAQPALELVEALCEEITAQLR